MARLHLPFGPFVHSSLWFFAFIALSLLTLNCLLKSKSVNTRVNHDLPDLMEYLTLLLKITHMKPCITMWMLILKSMFCIRSTGQVCSCIRETHGNKKKECMYISNTCGSMEMELPACSLVLSFPEVNSYYEINFIIKKIKVVSSIKAMPKLHFFWSLPIRTVKIKTTVPKQSHLC